MSDDPRRRHPRRIWKFYVRAGCRCSFALCPVPILVVIMVTIQVMITWRSSWYSPTPIAYAGAPSEGTARSNIPDVWTNY